MQTSEDQDRKTPVRIPLAVLLLGLASVPILVALIVAFTLWRTQAEVERSTGERLAEASRVLAQKADDIVGAAEARLTRYLSAQRADRLTSGALSPASPSESGLASIVLIFDARGALKGADVASSAVSIANRDYFSALQKGEPRSISGLIEQNAFGEPVFAVARRLDDAGGFAGAAVMYVPADSILDAWTKLGLGAEASIALYRTDGVLVSRFPLHTEPESVTVGQKVSFPSAQTGMTDSRRLGLSGAAHAIAFERVEGYPLIATASLPTAPAEAASRRRLQSVIVGALPILAILAGLCVALGWALISQNKKQVSLAKAVRQNETLLQEIHHRVKNNLQMVAGMVQLQFAGAQNEKNEVVRRIQAMTAVHQLMYETSEYAVLDARQYIGRLVEGLQLGGGSVVKITTDVAPVSLSVDQVQPLGLVINEATTNALKHGFPDGRAGTIRISLQRRDNQAELVVEDDGVGYDVLARASTGTKLIRSLVQQLQGEMTIASDQGTRLSVRFPIETAR